MHIATTAQLATTGKLKQQLTDVLVHPEGTKKEAK